MASATSVETVDSPALHELRDSQLIALHAELRAAHMAAYKSGDHDRADRLDHRGDIVELEIHGRELRPDGSCRADDDLDYSHFPDGLYAADAGDDEVTCFDAWGWDS